MKNKIAKLIEVPFELQGQILDAADRGAPASTIAIVYGCEVHVIDAIIINGRTRAMREKYQTDEGEPA